VNPESPKQILAPISRNIGQGEEDMTAQRTTDVLKEITGMSIGWAAVMIVLGFLAAFLPFATGIDVSIVVSWIILFGGIAHLGYAFAARDLMAFFWRILIGIVYVASGGYLAFHPGLTLESLALVVAGIFFVEGVLEVVAFYPFRALSGSGWMLFDGIMSLLLAFLIWYPRSSSSTWAIGILVGVNLIVSGFTRLMYSVAARNALKAAA
jgi:uncharacterized membrane protein HdeD (DUF308 family)